MSTRLKRSGFTQTVKLGGKKLRVRINPEKALTEILAASQKAGQPDADLAQTAVELIVGIFGEAAAKEIFAFYDGSRGETAERMLPLLLGKVMKSAVRVQKRRQRERAKLYC